MIETIFHGSKRIIERPIYGGGKPYNDYGPGFYCTKIEDMAKEWAVGSGNDGFSNRYQINEDGLKILYLSDEKYCILNWLAILIENRTFETTLPLAQEGKKYLLDNFMLPYKKYDIIKGYRADDSYFSFAQDFLSGAISVRQLSVAMHLGQLGEQYVIRSKKAFDSIEYVGYNVALSVEWSIKRDMRDYRARQNYRNMAQHERVKGDIFITHILDEEIKADDGRLRRVIS